ncbi:hypothetical protein D3C72_2147540 [compost metagenome]
MGIAGAIFWFALEREGIAPHACRCLGENRGDEGQQDGGEEGGELHRAAPGNGDMRHQARPFQAFSKAAASRAFV